MSDYTQVKTYHGQIGTAANYEPTPQPPSPLTELANISRKQTQDIRDITIQLSSLADRLFGPEPTALNVPMQQTTGPVGGQIDPPLVPAAEQTQFMVGEAIESLRRAVNRIDRL